MNVKVSGSRRNFSLPSGVLFPTFNCQGIFSACYLQHSGLDLLSLSDSKPTTLNLPWWLRVTFPAPLPRDELMLLE